MIITTASGASTASGSPVNGILLAISGLLFLTTYLFGLIALALWLAVRRDPIFAALAIAVQVADAADLDRIKHVVISHLARFAFREELAVEWQ